MHRRLPVDRHRARPATLPGRRTDPALHQRWEIKTAYLQLKSSILGGCRCGPRCRRHRSGNHALLIVCQLLDIAMVDATDSRLGTNRTWRGTLSRRS